MESITLVVCLILVVLTILLLRQNSTKEIEKYAYYDTLTGIPNMNKFKKLVEEVLYKNKDNMYIMMKMDIVNFKAVNEIFGYEVGNEILCAVAKAGENLNEKTFLHTRTNADNFFMFAEANYFFDFMSKKKEFENKFKEVFPVAQNHQFLFRYGRYLIDFGETDVHAIVNKADLAHSLAKKSNGELFWDYNEAFKRKLMRRTEITNKMEAALENGEFKVYLQPKYKISDSSIVGAEALVRWIEKDDNVVFPDEFIPLFEENDFIVNLDTYMLENACKILKNWKDAGFECIPISVNFSRNHLKNPFFVDEITEVTDRYGVDRKYIEVELTETAVTENEYALQSLLEDLRTRGFKVSIDDFGTGYSTLGMLKNFKVDTLKLDRSFFINNTEDNRGDIVVAGIINLAHDLGMSIVAEGVELSTQIDFLKKINCESTQCFLFAKPMPVADFEKLCFGDKIMQL